MKQIGKIGKINAKANKKLKKLWIKKDIRYCEVGEVLFNLIGFENCHPDFLIQNAHRHKRVDYRAKPEMLYSINQVVRACQYCHDRIENDRQLTEKVFEILRGPDEL